MRQASREMPAVDIRRTPDGKPDLEGFYEPDGGGANYGLEKRREPISHRPAGEA